MSRLDQPHTPPILVNLEQRGSANQKTINWSRDPSQPFNFKENQSESIVKFTKASKLWSELSTERTNKTSLPITHLGHFSMSL